MNRGQTRTIREGRTRQVKNRQRQVYRSSLSFLGILPLCLVLRLLLLELLIKII